jgi:RNA polymerase sigma factor (sigma-70 family)
LLAQYSDQRVYWAIMTEAHVEFIETEAHSEAEIPQAVGHSAIAEITILPVGADRQKPNQPPREESLLPDAYGAYLNRAGRVPLLTKEQEVELSKRVQAGLEARTSLQELPKSAKAKQTKLQAVIQDGLAAKEKFIEANLRLVISIAKNYQRPDLSLDPLDLIQEGNIGLAHAVDKFEWQKGFKFSTYASWWVKQAIIRAIGNQSDVIRIPTHENEKVRSLSRLEEQAGNDLRQRRVPHDQIAPKVDKYIMEQMSISKEKLEELRISRNIQPRSLNAPIGEDGSTLVDVVGDLSSTLMYEKAEDRFDAGIVQKVMQEVLDERERFVLSHHFALNGYEPKNLREIGLVLGLTRERIRQIESKAMEKVREFMEESNLSPGS